MLACAVMDDTEFVMLAASRLGIKMPERFVSRKWFTRIIRPLGEAPLGRSIVHWGKAGSVVLFVVFLN